MPDLIADSVFGRIVHLVSRGRLFASIERREPSRLIPYSLPKSNRSSNSSNSDLHAQSPNEEKADPTDTQLRSWMEKVFAPMEKRDSFRLRPYSVAFRSFDSDLSDLFAQSAIWQKVDLVNNNSNAEKGTDAQLVEFIENDPDVGWTLFKPLNILI